MNFSKNNIVLPKTQQKQQLKSELQEDAEKQYEAVPQKSGAICVQRGTWDWKLEVLVMILKTFRQFAEIMPQTSLGKIGVFGFLPNF